MDQNKKPFFNALEHTLDPHTTKGPNPATTEKPKEHVFVLGNIKTYGFSLISNIVKFER